MTAKTIMALIAIVGCLLLIVGCNVVPEKREKPDEKELVGDGDTTVSAEYLIMEVDYAPGGPSSQEEFDNGCNNFTITSEGHIVDKNKTRARLSEDDTLEVLKIYEKLCKGEITESNDEIMDGPTYILTIHKNGTTLSYKWDFNYQVDEVRQIMDIIWKYY